MGQRGHPVLIAVLSSLVTAVVMLLLAPHLLYPVLMARLGPELARIEARLATGEGARAGVRMVAAPGGAVEVPPPPLEVPPPEPGATLPPPTAVTAAAERVGPAVVGVVASSGGNGLLPGREEASGSGFVVDARGYIVTNNHVVEGADRVTVVLSDGRRLTARLVGADPRNDIALLHVDARGLVPAELGDSDRVRVGDLAIAIGNPMGLDFQRTVTAGVVSGLNRSLFVQDGRAPLEVIQTDAAISPGNSGGPLVDALGRVIGITTAKISMPGVEGMGFAIPVNKVRAVVEQLLATGKVVWPWLGVSLLDRQQVLEQGLNISLDRGVYVADVVPGSPADQAGLRAGDVILAVDGAAVDSYAAMRHALEAHRVGERVTLRVLRGKTELSLRATLAAWPDNNQS